MPEPRLFSLIGLGFGDCGKGRFTDALCRRLPVGAVIRFNGGAQAGHNVLNPQGMHHTFSQFSAGTFIPGVKSVLAAPFIFHPSALRVENEHLQTLGIHDALARLMVDERCLINTPFHQAAGRLRELERLHFAHGTCGVGVGETVYYAQHFPDSALRFADFRQPKLMRQKLECIRTHYLENFSSFESATNASIQVRSEYEILAHPEVIDRWLTYIAPILSNVFPMSREAISEQLSPLSSIVFEGAQGALLDEWRGFHPHTTWSSPLPESAERVAKDYGLSGTFMHLGILRTYLTRHGRGPFPTCDSELNTLPEPHNTSEGWQGEFRRGYPDGVLLKYALEICKKIDGLLVSHLDVFKHVSNLKWCEAYESHHDQYKVINRLSVSDSHDLAHQETLTKILSQCSPIYANETLSCARDFTDWITQLTGKKVLLGSEGASCHQVKTMDESQFVTKKSSSTLSF